MRGFGRGVVVGFLLASLLLGGAAGAVVTLAKIDVKFLPLKYYFDGVEKVPAAGEAGFIYNGRTYVPVRFMGESLGKYVQYDDKVPSVSIGTPRVVQPLYRRLPYFAAISASYGDGKVRWGEMQTQWVASSGKKYYNTETPSETIYISNSYTYAPYKEYELNGLYTKLTGQIMLSYEYRNSTNTVMLRILGDGREIFSAAINPQNAAVPVSVDITGYTRIRVEVNTPLKANPADNTPTEIGLIEWVITNY